MKAEQLTESQLFTIEALNGIEGFTWPDGAMSAAMLYGSEEVYFYSDHKSFIHLFPSKFEGKLMISAAVSCEKCHPDWRNSLITKEQFDSVGRWLQATEENESWRYHKLSGLEINKKDSIPTLTDEQCLKFLSVAFRHCEIKGNVTFDDIRLGLKMALEKGHE